MVRPTAVIPPMTRRSTAAPAAPPAAEQDAPPSAAPETPKPDFAPVIRSKIQPPALRSTTLSRQRLIDRLHEASASRVTLVVAEAGYGKTTLLADFASRSGQRILWYRLDPTDADAITWANYLVAACREVSPNFGSATSALLSQIAGAGGPPKSLVLAGLMDELQQMDAAPTLLVLDDFHTIDSSSEARELVERLVRDAPHWLHMLIASRRKPSLRLGRLEACGELAHLGTDDLRFSLSETEHLFADRFGSPLEDDVLKDVDRRAKGWAASLQLFYGSIRGKRSIAVRALARSLSGDQSPLYDFLADEVLANIPTEIEQFLVRASLLDQIVPEDVVPLFSDIQPPVTDQVAQSWISEADRMALLARKSEWTEARELHPLLRDFLLRRLRVTSGPQGVANLHLRLARAAEGRDPLMAGGHFLDAGADQDAMRCLEGSVMLTIGSGQWGAASELIDRLKGVPASPAVAAIQARRLAEDGDLARARRLLDEVDESASPAAVRAEFRHAKLSVGWRMSDRELLFRTLDDIRRDPETPVTFQDIAQVMIDTSPLSAAPITYPRLVGRLKSMSKAQAKAGHSYYAAISLHNASVAAVAAGMPTEAVRLCEAALSAYQGLSVPVNELYSTYANLAICWLELGNAKKAEEFIAIGLSSGSERGDVHSEFAFLSAVIGQTSRAHQLMRSAEALNRNGLSDMQGVNLAIIARSFLALADAPDYALELLNQLPDERPLDVGDTLKHQAMECLAHLLAGRAEQAAEMAGPLLARANELGARVAACRLSLTLALARGDRAAFVAAVEQAVPVGELGLLEVADAVGPALARLVPLSEQVIVSMQRWPDRWLPIMRRELAKGEGPSSRAAASVLEEVGTAEDIPRLRAYAKTYARRGRVSMQLGKVLARRSGPRLEINDLGRVSIRVGDRDAPLSRSRRKAAGLLMFLVTRPKFTATREQVLDELWPDADPASATNSLNQSLYFLRRDIDPWYEDDLSIDYVSLEGELVWLDGEMVHVASADFLAKVRDRRAAAMSPEESEALLELYTGRFAPEFEYEEWAIGWRQRVHAAYLEFASETIECLSASGTLALARDISSRVIEIDPDAREIEQKLIRLYWRLGARSAAAAQYEHLASLDRTDGLEPLPLRDITEL